MQDYLKVTEKLIIIIIEGTVARDFPPPIF
jgi:hypothetical protein